VRVTGRWRIEDEADESLDVIDRDGDGGAIGYVMPESAGRELREESVDTIDERTLARESAAMTEKEGGKLFNEGEFLKDVG
jgi:hypothetical protein